MTLVCRRILSSESPESTLPSPADLLFIALNLDMSTASLGTSPSRDGRCFLSGDILEDHSDECACVCVCVCACEDLVDIGHMIGSSADAY